MSASWSVTQDKVNKTLEKIVAFCRPSRLILFGSYVTGRTHINSDLDILVVTKEEVANPRKESVRIRRALKGILMPMDILVVSEKRLEELSDTPGLIYREALNSGKVVYESAA